MPTILLTKYGRAIEIEYETARRQRISSVALAIAWRARQRYRLELRRVRVIGGHRVRIVERHGRLSLQRV